MSFTPTNPLTGKPAYPRLNVPEIFGHAMSYGDQIQMLLAYVNSVLEGADVVSDEELQAAVQGLAQQIASAVDGLNGELENAVARLQREIEETAKGQEIYAVYLGGYGPNQDVMRGTAAFVAVHAITCGQLAAMEITAQQLSDSGINCHGLAVLGTWLASKGYELPDRFKPRAAPAPGVARDLVSGDMPNMAVNEQMFVVLKEQ